jgi:hypothetical protein
MDTVRIRAALTALLLVTGLLSTPARGELAPALQAELTRSTYVYIATTRKDGSLGKAAEIWFLYHNGAVYVASPPTAWRVRRIKAGRPQAKIAVGKSDGPSFIATGAVVNEPEVSPILFETYAKKYPDGWPKFEGKFRSGLKDGSRVLIKYTPKESQ